MGLNCRNNRYGSTCITLKSFLNLRQQSLKLGTFTVPDMDWKHILKIGNDTQNYSRKRTIVDKSKPPKKNNNKPAFCTQGRILFIQQYICNNCGKPMKSERHDSFLSPNALYCACGLVWCSDCVSAVNSDGQKVRFEDASDFERCNIICRWCRCHEICIEATKKVT